ncbi:MAG: hypothetical protein QG570_484 [Patescibacteria group bacterium]|nr:hypothetical protein [Patescibacteria group bacterium]
MAGASTKSVEEKELNGEVEFSISENEYVRVRSNPDTGATLIGYATKSNQTQKGLQVWGASYNNNENGKSATNQSNQPMGKWITSTFEIYEKDGDGYKLKLSDKGEIVKESGYIAMLDNVQMLSFRQLQPQVLGESTEIILESENRPSVLAGTTEDKSLALVTTDDLKSTAQQIEQKTSEVLEGITEVNGEVIFQDSEATSKEKIIKVALSSDAIKEAVVNRAMLKVLNISEEDSIGKTFDVAFIVPGTLLDNASDGKVQSESTSYEIVGVVPQDDSPFFYAPFIDLRGIGVTNYSQVKLVSDRQDVLSEIRKKVESMGFLTSSVVDTVQQINSLFATARTVLALIGTVALAVAALGMFNTLTVSLLERIREIGLMKAMGMKSSEVKELFLTESMIMGFFGGILGIVMGYLAGKFVSVILTLVAIKSNSGFLDIATVPVSIVIIVMGLSITVGLITGIYPARKATRISALNALRYE